MRKTMQKKNKNESKHWMWDEWKKKLHEMAQNYKVRIRKKQASFAIEFMSTYINQLIGRISQIKLHA